MMWQGVKYIAHRGASGYAPENTISAFQTAYDMGATWIEFDVMLSHDGELFVFHDEGLSRTTNGTGRMQEVSSDYVKTLDAGVWFSAQFKGEKIPTLKEALLWLTSIGCNANIEIKPHPAQQREIVWAVLQTLNLYWPHDRTRPLISSFDETILTLCRELEPELPLAYLVNTWENHTIDRALALSCLSVHLPKKQVTPERVLALKKAGFQVGVFTVNCRSEALRYLSYGIDVVFSNYPDVFERTLWQQFLKKFWIKRRASPKIKSK